MVYILLFSTSVLTNWIMLRETTIMVEIAFFYLPLIYIAACLNSIALKMLIYSTCVRCFRHDEINVMSHSILTYSFNLGIIAYLYYVDTYFVNTKFWISIILLILPAWFSLRFMLILSKTLVSKICFCFNNNKEQSMLNTLDRILLSDTIDMGNFKAFCIRLKSFTN